MSRDLSPSSDINKSRDFLENASNDIRFTTDGSHDWANKSRDLMEETLQFCQLENKHEYDRLNESHDFNDDLDTFALNNSRDTENTLVKDGVSELSASDKSRDQVDDLHNHHPAVTTSDVSRDQMDLSFDSAQTQIRSHDILVTSRDIAESLLDRKEWWDTHL